VSGALTLESRDAGGMEGNASSNDPFLAPGGGFLAFETAATNLMVGPPMSSAVLLRDLTTGAFDDVNLDSLGNPLPAGGSRQPSVSADGRYVAFEAGPVVPVTAGRLYVRDRLLAKTIAVCSSDTGNGQMTGAGFGPRLSGDGTTVAFISTGGLVPSAGPGNGEAVYVRGIGAPLTYCSPKLNGLGCQPSIGFSGEARVSNGIALTVTCTQVLNNKVGLLVFGKTGPWQVPFGGGSLCVATPLSRSAGVHSGGSPAPAQDCSGFWSHDLGAVLSGSPLGPSIGAGSVLVMQWWGRDPFLSAPENVQLSDALQVFVAP
jgi:hypothetical protein